MKKRISTSRGKSRSQRLYNKSKKMRMHLDTKTGVLIIAAAAVLIFILVLAIASKSNLGGSGNNPGPLPSYAPQGQFVSGFPKELILDSAAQASNSYMIRYSAANQYTAEWDSKMSMSALYSAYLNYFQSNKWTIANTFTTGSSVRAIYAKMGSSVANISITAQKNVSHVVISYVK